MQYSDQKYDILVGVYNNRRREYVPGNGIFTTIDPYASDPNNPQSYNNYLDTWRDPAIGAEHPHRTNLRPILVFVHDAAALRVF